MTIESMPGYHSERKINCEYNDLAQMFIATFDDYDGAPDADDHFVGFGYTEQEAIDNLNEML